MKNQSIKHLVILIVLVVLHGCAQMPNRGNTDLQVTEQYSGPIIDMNIHAYADGHPLFGMTHPPTLRGVTYEGVTSADELKEKTLEKFREHNIVKAVVTNGQLWFNNRPDSILIGGAI